jgi:hypothetical protein
VGDERRNQFLKELQGKHRQLCTLKGTVLWRTDPLLSSDSENYDHLWATAQ